MVRREGRWAIGAASVSGGAGVDAATTTPCVLRAVTTNSFALCKMPDVGIAADMKSSRKAAFRGLSAPMARSITGRVGGLLAVDGVECRAVDSSAETGFMSRAGRRAPRAPVPGCESCGSRRRGTVATARGRARACRRAGGRRRTGVLVHGHDDAVHAPPQTRLGVRVGTPLAGCPALRGRCVHGAQGVLVAEPADGLAVLGVEDRHPGARRGRAGRREPVRAAGPRSRVRAARRVARPGRAGSGVVPRVPRRPPGR